MKILSTVSAVILVLFFTSGLSHSQSLYFCEGVDDDGYAIDESSVFTIPDDGGYLYVLTRLPYEVACKSVRYEVYKVNSRGKETYDNTIYQDVEKGWVWFWKQITFYDRGTYKIYVYDEDWKFLTSNTVKISYR